MAEYYRPEERRGQFYEKIFTKTIQKDIEVGARDDVEGLLGRLDSGEEYLDDKDVVDAEFSVVGEFEDDIVLD